MGTALTGGFLEVCGKFRDRRAHDVFWQQNPDKLLVKLWSGRQFQILPHTSENRGSDKASDVAIRLKILVEEVVDCVPVELGVNLRTLGVGGAMDGELLLDLAGARVVVFGRACCTAQRCPGRRG